MKRYPLPRKKKKTYIKYLLLSPFEKHEGTKKNIFRTFLFNHYQGYRNWYFNADKARLIEAVTHRIKDDLQIFHKIKKNGNNLG